MVGIYLALTVTSSVIDKKLEIYKKPHSKLNSKFTKNLENKLEIYSYFKLKNKLKTFEFFVNGRWTQFKYKEKQKSIN